VLLDNFIQFVDGPDVLFAREYSIKMDRLILFKGGRSGAAASSRKKKEEKEKNISLLHFDDQNCKSGRQGNTGDALKQFVVGALFFPPFSSISKKKKRRNIKVPASPFVGQVVLNGSHFAKIFFSCLTIRRLSTRLSTFSFNLQFYYKSLECWFAAEFVVHKTPFSSLSNPYTSG